MKKSSLKNYILLTLLASALWLGGSWWHYACNIKNTCGTANTIVSNPSENKVVDNIIDTDEDGLSDIEEAKLGTDPLLMDTDQDGISDSEEVGVNLDTPLDSDKDNIIDALDMDDDNDGLATSIELQVGTSTLHADTDKDGILDNVEIGTNENAPLDSDCDDIITALDTDDDDDGIETINEAVYGTNHLLVDTDGDGLSDSKEIGDLMDKPLDSDKDGIIDAVDTEEDSDQDKDGLSDAVEAKLLTDPTKVDSDGDGINDAEEIGDNLSQPLDSDLDGIIDALDAVDNSDSDNDGLSDSLEIKLKSNPELADSDDDGINDREELGKNAEQPLDSDNDGILNINDKDDDNDNLSTRYEMRIGTNPLDDDTDKDGLADNVEAKSPDSDKLQDTDNDNIINPNDEDDDNDGIPTLNEIALGTNPLDADSDNDGISDADEIGSNLEAAKDTDKDGIIDALDVRNDPVKPEVADTDDDTKAKKQETGKDSVKENDPKDKNDGKSVSIEFVGTAEEDSIQKSILYFPYYSADPVIESDATSYLKKVVEWMKQNPENLIALTGHTDNIGSKQSNLALGIRRVMVIRELLIEQGAPMKQIDIMSRGESQPLQSNKTEAGRLKNRRVEITPVKR